MIIPLGRKYGCHKPVKRCPGGHNDSTKKRPGRSKKSGTQPRTPQERVLVLTPTGRFAWRWRPWD